MAMIWDAADVREVATPLLAQPLTETEAVWERDQTVQLAVAKAMEAVDTRFTEAALTREAIASLITEAVATYATEVASLKIVNAELREAITQLERRPAVQVNVPAPQQHFEIQTPTVRGGDIIVKTPDASAAPAWWRQPKETTTEVIEQDKEGMPTKTRAVHSY